MKIVKGNLKIHAVSLSGVIYIKKKTTTLVEKYQWETLQYICKVQRGVGMFSHHIFLSGNTFLDRGKIGDLVVLTAVPSLFTVTFPALRKQERA